MREAEGVAVVLEQSRKKERALEEEGRRLAEELADTLRLVKELQGEIKLSWMFVGLSRCTSVVTLMFIFVEKGLQRRKSKIQPL